MNAALALVATDLETAADATTSGNPSPAGYWSRIAAASETLADATTNANATISGYMLRAALALESIAGTDGTDENASYYGYLKRIVDALEVQAGAVTEGSWLNRLVTAAANASFGGLPTIDADTTFATTTGWTDVDGGGTADMSISDGTLNAVGGTGVALELMTANILNCPAPGATVNLQYEITTAANPSALRVNIGIGNSAAYVSSSSVVGTHTTSITVGAVDTILRIRNSGSSGVDWSMASIAIVS